MIALGGACSEIVGHGPQLAELLLPAASSRGGVRARRADGRRRVAGARAAHVGGGRAGAAAVCRIAGGALAVAPRRLVRLAAGRGRVGRRRRRRALPAAAGVARRGRAQPRRRRQDILPWRANQLSRLPARRAERGVGGGDEAVGACRTAPTPLASAEAWAAEFDAFLEEHGPSLGVLVVEPQWGSSCAGAVWPPELLARVERARARRRARARGRGHVRAVAPRRAPRRRWAAARLSERRARHRGRRGHVWEGGRRRRAPAVGRRPAPRRERARRRRPRPRAGAHVRRRVAARAAHRDRRARRCRRFTTTSIARAPPSTTASPPSSTRRAAGCSRRGRGSSAARSSTRRSRSMRGARRRRRRAAPALPRRGSGAPTFAPAGFC